MKSRECMVGFWVILGKTATLALACHHMNHNRLVQVFSVPDNLGKKAHIMAFNGPYIFKAQIHKKVVSIKNRFYRSF
jgi:hypothetical protein